MADWLPLRLWPRTARGWLCTCWGGGGESAVAHQGVPVLLVVVSVVAVVVMVKAVLDQAGVSTQR
jgi:hypothetical protein